MFQQKPASPPLAGVRILDLGRYHAAPRCAAELGRLGADVIKVEPIGGDESRTAGTLHDGVGIGWALQNHAKRSISIDLKSEQGRQLVRQLAGVSDVVVHNFRPGVMEGMGLAYDSLRAVNRRLILVNISGAGRSSPVPAFDPVLQAASGLMSLNGDPAGGPCLVPFPIIDRLTAMNAALEALAALMEARQTGHGQEIDVSLADAARSTVEVPLAVFLVTGQSPERAGNATGLGNVFACRDGHVYIGDYGSDRIFDRLARHLGEPGWPNDPRLSTRAARTENSGVVEAALVNWCEQRDVASAIASLEGAEVPCGRVNDLARVASSGDVERVLLAGGPDREEVIAAIRNAPRPGEHTDEILTGVLGLAPAEVAALRRAGTVV